MKTVEKEEEGYCGSVVLRGSEEDGSAGQAGEKASIPRVVVSPVYVHHLTVRFSDEDMNKHTNHKVYMSWIEDAIEVLRSVTSRRQYLQLVRTPVGGSESEMSESTVNSYENVVMLRNVLSVEEVGGRKGGGGEGGEGGEGEGERMGCTGLSISSVMLEYVTESRAGDRIELWCRPVANNDTSGTSSSIGSTRRKDHVCMQINIMRSTTEHDISDDEQEEKTPKVESLDQEHGGDGGRRRRDLVLQARVTLWPLLRRTKASDSVIREQSSL